jgi:hypothetical protein
MAIITAFSSSVKEKKKNLILSRNVDALRKSNRLSEHGR